MNAYKIRTRSTSRARLYREPRIQMLLSALLTGRLNEVKPYIDRGGVQRFPPLESLLGASPSDVKSIVRRLTNARVLVKKTYNRVMCCPSCKDPSSVFVRHLCPSCNSNNLSVEKTLRHLVCGNEIRISETHGVERGICEKCLKPIIGDGDCTVLGTALSCNDCGTVNLEIIQTYYCSVCDTEFSISNAAYLDMFSYMLNKRFAVELHQNLVLPIVVKVLLEAGFMVQTPGYLTGTSGSTYDFGLIASKGETVIAFEVLQSETKIGAQSVLPTLSKLAEQRSVHAFLVATPGLDEDARQFAKRGNISCIEGTIHDIITNGLEKIRAYVAELATLNVVQK